MAEKPSILGIVAGAVGILAAVIPLGVYFARIDPSMEANRRDIAALSATVAADRASIAKEQEVQNQRFDRIEEARAVNLQRLARVEEAIAATKDTLAQINGKLDRVLMRR